MARTKPCRLHFAYHFKPLASAMSLHVCATATTPWTVVTKALRVVGSAILHYVAVAHVRAHVFLMTRVSSKRASCTREAVPALRRHRLELPINLDALFEHDLFWPTSVSKLDLRRKVRDNWSMLTCVGSRKKPIQTRDDYRRGRFLAEVERSVRLVYRHHFLHQEFS
jgi:hypothetical protein